MINTSKIFRNINLGATAIGLLIFCGMLAEAHAQRDPFAQPSYKREKKPVTSGGAKVVKTGVAAPASYVPPGIEARIEYYKRLREVAVANGAPIPKVTSVLTLGEMAVTGIFKTPRGYAAMVEATPIKLSYTIYPGEKFFDGQLVAVEENRLVFRKVTKTGEGKFVASVENKPLKQYSMKAQVEGTAPTQSDRPVEVAQQPAAGSDKAVKPASNPFLSPLDEMNNAPVKTEADKPKKGPKKPVKVAKNNGN